MILTELFYFDQFWVIFQCFSVPDLHSFSFHHCDILNDFPYSTDQQECKKEFRIQALSWFYSILFSRIFLRQLKAEDVFGRCSKMLFSVSTTVTLLIWWELLNLSSWWADAVFVGVENVFPPNNFSTNKLKNGFCTSSSDSALDILK